MKKKSILYVVFILFITALIFSQCTTSTSKYKYPFLNPDLPIDQRVNDVVGRMTLQEKVSQMQSQAPGIPRLGIPPYPWWSEGLHGVAYDGIATVFPQAIGMAATWDPHLIHQEANVISTEARAKNNEAARLGDYRKFKGLTFWSPNINLDRDPRWGRGQETYGEDPFLTSKFAVAFVKGLQGDDPKYFKVISTPKHFVVHSGPEPLRHKFNAVTSERDFYESYLPAFKAAVMEGKAYSVMGAYSAYKGIPDVASSFLLDTILRKKFGFKGYVVSDCGAIGDIVSGHHMVKSLAEASAIAVKAGTDLDCGNEYSTLTEAVKNGLISEQEIDKSVKRLFKARFLLGMFDPPERVKYTQIPASSIDTKENRALARKVAQESMVLLKNKGALLPLSNKISSIAVIGPYADKLDVLEGSYHGTPSHPVTFLQGIRNAAKDKIKVTYAMGAEPLSKTEEMNTVDSLFFHPSGTSKTFGLKAEYFNNQDLKGKPVLVRVEPIMRLRFNLGSPGKGVSKDHFSVRWTGKLIAPANGEFELGLTTNNNNKGRLYLDGKLLLDNWDPHEANVMKTYQVNLKKGHKYDIKIEYTQVSGFESIRFLWRNIKSNMQSESDVLISEAVEKARKADLAVVVVGISPRLEGEEKPVYLEGFKGGDRTSLNLPAPYEKLLQAIANTGKPVVLVLTGGGALSVNWAQKHIPAIIMAWYPGEEGGNALADILFGKVSPSGRLPVTFYHSVKDLPPFTDYFMKGRTYRFFTGKPLYPFGYGLSYTTYKYSDLKIENHSTNNGNAKVDISFKLTDTGSRAGAEVAQVYVHEEKPGIDRPNKALKGFVRVKLNPGESKIVHLTLAKDAFEYWSPGKNGWVLDPNAFDILVGSSSADIHLQGRVKLTLNTQEKG